MTDAVYMFDSNICIYLLEGLSDNARLRVEQCRPQEVVCSAISYAEVLRGLDINDVKAVQKTNALFDVVRPLDFNAKAALNYMKMPFKRHRFDRLIASHALSLSLTLVTNNETDFLDVPGLKVENWTVA